MTNRIKLTNNFVNDIDDVIGFIEFADTPKANFLFEMLKLKPNSFDVASVTMGNSPDDAKLLNYSLVNRRKKFNLTKNQEENLDTFYNSFHVWLKNNGVVTGLPTYSDLFEAHVDLNKLKAAIMVLAKDMESEA